MGIDPSAIGQGILSSLITDRLKSHANKVIDSVANDYDIPRLSVEEYLHLIHLTLVNIELYLKHSTGVQGDLFDFVTLYKSASGPPFKPSHHEDRQHFVLWTPTAIVLNCSGTGLGNFNMTTKVADWTIIDLPDGALYTVDASNANSQYIVWLRETNANVV